MQKPLVSIITPCYNGEKFIDRYFESILSQTYSNLELIFINDGSEDRTEEIALSYTKKLEDNRIKFIYLSQKNAGQAAALNQGLKVFSGEYLTWPDSDDVMTADCIEKKVAFLEQNPKYDMVRSNGLFYDQITGITNQICESSKAAKEDIFEDLLVLKTYGCCGCYMIRRRLFDEIYPEKKILESRCGQNWQILVPAASKTKCGYIDEALYIIYENNNSHSRINRTLEQIIKREEDFKEILLDAIEHSDCDRKKYQNIVAEKCARNQFYYAVHYGNKKEMRRAFKVMKYYGNVSIREWVIFCKHTVLGRE